MIGLSMLPAESVISAPKQTESTAGQDWPAIIAQLKDALWKSTQQSEVKAQLAIAYNNYGVSLGEQSKWEPAIAQMEEAVRLAPEDPEFKSNLARIYLQQAASLRGGEGNASKNRQQSTKVTGLLRKALANDPELAEAYAMLGELEYESQHLKEAKKAWEHAKKLNPTLPGLNEALARLNTEIPVESDFDRLSHLYFDIRYEEGVDRSVGFNIQEVLLEARRTVGNDFRYWPSSKIVVIVYSAQTFRSMRQDTPEWVGGQFDGKIRLPLPGGDYDAQTVRQILFHEYTHAVVRDLSRNRCPIWFNEGLAEYQGARAGKKRVDQLKQALVKNQLIAWPGMNQGFSQSLTATQVALAYQQAHSIVEYLAQRYGFFRLRKVLAHVGDGMPVETALTQEFKITLERLERHWRESLPGFVG